MGSFWENEIKRELEALKEKALLRSLPPIEDRRGPWVKIEGKWRLNLASNDYLGLGATLTWEEAQEVLASWGAGAGASRLLSGNHLYYQFLEQALEESYGRPALVFSSGYLANLGVICGLAGRRDLILADKLVHASLIDALRLSGARFYRYPHRDLKALEDLLRQHRGRFRRALIVTESVFSMDGDFPDLKALVELARRFEALLVLDEAHAIGVFGRRGLGLAEELGVLSEVDVLVGTFGKALGSYGAFVVLPEAMKNLLLSKARSFIFTTALPPVVVAFSLKAFKRLPALEEARQRVRGLASSLRQALGLSAPGLEAQVPIVPVILGASERALAVSRDLFSAGFWAPAIRPPTVPEGTARLRLSLTALMEESQLEPLVQRLRELRCA